VAHPAPTHDDEPPLADPEAIRRAYQRERARRRAQIERRRESRHARLRFWAIMWVLLVLCVVAALTIWSQVQQLFGL
jgi:type VI protein secretion system component VasF